MPQGTFIGQPIYSADVPPVTVTMDGIWYDGSALSAYDLDTVVIRIALQFGVRWFIDTDRERWESYAQPHEVTVEEADFMRDAADQALDWLNENVAPEGLAFVIEDNSLFLWDTEA